METFTQAKGHSPNKRRGLFLRLLLLLLLGASGQAAWAAATYSSSSVSQASTAAVGKGVTNAQVIKVTVVTSGSGGSRNLTSLTVNTTGTTNVSDIQNLRVYFTGTSDAFATTTQFGSTVATPVSGNNAVTGTQALASSSTNYFWVTYDVKTSASTGNVIDATCPKLRFDGTDYTPSPTTASGDRTITSALSGGTYTIGGTSPDYATFSDAVTELTDLGVGGAVTFNVHGTSGSPVTYNEQITIPAIAGASSTNTITFQGNSSDRTAVILSYASGNTNGNHLVYLNGASYITFKDMKLARTGTASTNAKVIVFGADAANNTFQNCVITNDFTTSNSTAVRLAENISTNTSSGNTFRNNSFENGSEGLYITTSSASSGNVIENNTFTGQYNYNLYIQKLQAVTVRNNTFERTGGATDNVCVRISDCDGAVAFTGNKINMTSGGYGLYLEGINGASGTGNQQFFANNFISVSNAGGGTFYGIYLGTSPSYINFYHNSISGTGTNGWSVYINAGANLEFKNNIIYCSSTNTSHSALRIPSTVPGVFDYNDLYVTGGAKLVDRNGTTYATLALWQAYNSTPQHDDNSVSVNPAFTSASDLHAAHPSLNAKGTPLASVTTDYDGDARHATTPDIGADEFTPSASDAALTGSMSPSGLYCPGSQSVTVTLQNMGTSTLTSAVFNWNVGGTAQTAYNWTGSLASGATTTVTIGTYNFASGTYSLDATVSSPNGATDPTSANNIVSTSLTAAKLTGTYTIGSTGSDYATFAAALTALNTYGVCGPVTFNVRSGTYTEQLSIGSITGVSSTNRITFQSLSGVRADVMLSQASSGSSANNYVINLNGADYITFKDMTLQRTGSSSNKYARVVTMSSGSDFNEFQNCIIANTRTSSTATSNDASLIYIDYSGEPDNITFSGNLFQNGEAGIYFYAGNHPSSTLDIRIEDNSFQGQTIYGLWLERIDGAKVRGNTFTRSGGSSTTACAWIINCDDAVEFTGNRIQMTIGGYGLRMENGVGTSGTRQLVANNFISVNNAGAVRPMAFTPPITRPTSTFTTTASGPAAPTDMP